MRLSSLGFFTFFSIALLSGCNEGNAPKSDWVLDNDYSSLSITSIKKSSVAEAFHFKTITGKISPSGEVQVEINLASIESNVDIRNQRMKKSLFEVILHPSAMIKAKLDLKEFTSLNPGYRIKKDLPFILSLHGQEKELEAEVYITRLSASSFSVSTVKPVMVSAEDFGLMKGIKKLMKLAKLKSIDSVVPTSFNLLFKQK